MIHDDHLNRLTGESGYFSDISNPETLRLKNGEPVPTLEAVLDLVWGKLPVNIEIKSSNTSTLLLDMLKRFSPPATNETFPKILISSFDQRQLKQLRLKTCPWELSPVVSGVPLNIGETINTLKPYSWNMDDEFVDPEIVQQLKSFDIPVMVYTVNDPDRARYLKQIGVRGIFTDNPSMMLNIN